jgi:hypothetical protein
MPSDALKRIEEKHQDDPKRGGHWCYERGVFSPNPDGPCDMVKLARALDAACDALDAWGHHSDAKTFRNELQRSRSNGLEEVAGE